MRNKSTLICFRLLSAILSAIISFGFLASMCCCNCGSAYASEAAKEETADQGEQNQSDQEDSSTVSNQYSDNKNEDSSQAENETACKAAVVAKDSSKPKDSDTRYEKCKVYKGHTDGIAVYMDKSGHLVLGTQGDYFPGVPKNGVRYNSDRIEFMLGSNTKLKKSDLGQELSFLPKNNSGDYVWALPQVQDNSKLWLGFTTQTLPRKTVSAVKFRLKSADIPEGGAVYVYENDSHGKVIPVLGSPNTDFPHKFYRNDNTHLHVNWVFTKPGKYVLGIEVTVKTKDGKILKDSQGYTFNVDMQDGATGTYFHIEDKDADDDGELNKHENQSASEGDEDGDDSDNEDEESEDNEDEDDEDSSTSIVINGNNNRVYVTPWPGAKPNGGLANQSSDEEDGNGKSEGGNGSEGESGSETESGSEAESKGKNKKQKTVKKCSKFKDLQGDKLVIKHGHVDLATYSTGNGIGFAVQEDVTGSHVKRDPSKVVFYAGKSAKDKGVWRLPQTQKNSVPWVGWSNQNLSPHKPSKISLKSVKGPGSVRIWLQGGLGVKAKTLMSSSGNSTYTIPANTHMHLNWDFSKSGYYTITFAVSANGKTVTKDFHFAIGVDPMEKPMSCSTTKVDGEDGDSDDKSNETDEDEDSENNSDDEDSQNNDKNNKDNNNDNSGNNGNSGNNSGTTPLAAAARGNSGSRASFFGGGFGASKSANRGKTGRSVSLSGSTLGKSKGLQSKYNAKRIKGLSQSLKSGVKSEEPRGIVGLFKRKPVVAYTALSLGITAISGTCAAGLFVLRKRGLIPAGGLFRALMNLK